MALTFAARARGETLGPLIDAAAEAALNNRAAA
jgi:hypothetical protein